MMGLPRFGGWYLHYIFDLVFILNLSMMFTLLQAEKVHENVISVRNRKFFAHSILYALVLQF
jgi:hypothetical protein